MRIIYIHKAEVHRRPPVLSVLTHLVSLMHEVHLITCGVNDEIRRKLESMGISIHLLPYASGKTPYKKAIEYYKFRTESYKIINQLCNEDTLLWVESGYTIVALGSKLNNYKFLLQIQELHENDSYTLKAIKKVISNALAVFMPEYNRCVLYQLWFQLNNRPYVMPNIPSFLPSEDDLKIYADKYSDYLKKIKDKIVIIYQGYIIGADRPLDNYVKAIEKLGEKYQLVLVGKASKEIADYQRILPNLIHIDFVPSPEYLFFTKSAHIGIVSYDQLILNNAYCAPNKVFEYANYKLPMIGNDIPGLKYLIEFYHIGRIVNELDVDDIANNIKEISKNYQTYSEASYDILNVFDNRNLIEQVLGKIAW